MSKWAMGFRLLHTGYPELLWEKMSWAFYSKTKNIETKTFSLQPVKIKDWFNLKKWWQYCCTIEYIEYKWLFDTVYCKSVIFHGYPTVNVSYHYNVTSDLRAIEVERISSKEKNLHYLLLEKNSRLVLLLQKSGLWFDKSCPSGHKAYIKTTASGACSMEYTRSRQH